MAAALAVAASLLKEGRPWPLRDVAVQAAGPDRGDLADAAFRSAAADTRGRQDALRLSALLNPPPAAAR